MLKKIKPLDTSKESAIPFDLIQKLRTGKVLAFIGSGLSMPLGYPSWKSLINDIYKQIGDAEWGEDFQTKRWVEEKSKSEPVWVAEVLKHKLEGQYYEALNKLFEKKTPPPFSPTHAIFSALPFRGYITTNYDCLIENYLEAFDSENPKVLLYEDAVKDMSFLDSSNRFVLKTHGCINKGVNSFVLTSSDYYSLINESIYRRLLSFLMSRYTILIAGFSLQDKDFRHFISERYYLYKKNGPTIYALLGKNETCLAERDTYLQKYNIQVIPILEENNYEELSSTLLSLYCLTYHVDSSIVTPAVNHLLGHRVKSSTRIDVPFVPKLNKDMKTAEKLLAVFKDPIPLDAFTVICTDNSLNLTPAHYRLLGHTNAFGAMNANPRIKPTKVERKIVANWLATVFNSIPIGKTPRYFSIYHKSIFDNYTETLYSLLLTEEGWEALIGSGKAGELKFKRINEYFRQQGLWDQWLRVVEKAEKHVKQSSSLHLNLIRSKMWVYFWTRRFEEAKVLLQNAPDIDTKGGDSSYKSKLKYMKPHMLKELIEKYECDGVQDYFAISLLGRAYARLWLKDNSKTNTLLEKAESYIKHALDESTKKKDLIEASVQSWYLACIKIDLNKIEEAKALLADVKRLDESIMDRKPGIAWLKVANYRLMMKISDDEAFISNSRLEAVNAMKSLGMQNVEDFVDKEYYY